MRKPLINTSVLKMALVGSILSLGANASAALEWHEDFDYAAGNLETVSSTTWAAISGAGSNPIQVTAGNLSYAGMPASTGSHIRFNASGEDNARTFTTTTSGTVYASFLLRVPSTAKPTAAGDYSFGLRQSGGSFTFRGWIQDDGTTNNFDLSLSKGSNTIESTTSALNYDQDYFVVISYNFGAGTGDDVLSLWVNPTWDAAEPVATITGSTGTDAPNLAAFFLRQASNQGTPYFDEIRVGTTWEDVANTPVPPPPVLVDGDTTDASYVSIGTFTGSHSYGDHGLLELKAYADATDLYFGIVGESEDNSGNELYLFFGSNGSSAGVAAGTQLPAGSDGLSPFGGGSAFRPRLDFECDFGIRMTRDSGPNTYVSIVDYRSGGNTDTFIANLGAGGSHTQVGGPYNGLQVAYTDSGLLSSNTGQGLEIKFPLSTIGATARLSETVQALALYGSNDFISGDSIPETTAGSPHLGANPNFNNISGRQAADFNGVTPATDINAAFANAANTIRVRFDSDAPTIAFAPGHFTLNDFSGASVTGIANVSGDDYDLTLSVNASGDTTSDTLTFDNGVDPVESYQLFSGIMSLAAFRGTVDTGGNWLPTIPSFAVNVTVTGTVVEDTLDAMSGGRNVFIQDGTGTSGVQIRGNSGVDLASTVAVGDTVVFAGNVGAFNGLQQIVERSANGIGLLSNVTGTAPTPIDIDVNTITAAQLEAAEGTLVRITAEQFVDAGNFAGDTDYALTGVSSVIVRISADLTDIVGQAIPTGDQNIIGVVGQFDNSPPHDSGYQVLPRSLADIQSVASVSDWSVLND